VGLRRSSFVALEFIKVHPQVIGDMDDRQMTININLSFPVLFIDNCFAIVYAIKLSFEARKFWE
jgi:hypothetical protein